MVEERQLNFGTMSSNNRSVLMQGRTLKGFVKTMVEKWGVDLTALGACHWVDTVDVPNQGYHAPLLTIPITHNPTIGTNGTFVVVGYAPENMIASVVSELYIPRIAICRGLVNDHDALMLALFDNREAIVSKMDAMLPLLKDYAQLSDDDHFAVIGVDFPGIAPTLGEE